MHPYAYLVGLKKSLQRETRWTKRPFSDLHMKQLCRILVRCEKRVMRPDKPELGECWVVINGCLNSGGYAAVADACITKDVGLGHNVMGAHVATYRLTTGDMRPLLVLHACDTPHCVKPEHLSVGTQDDNMQQMVERGRTSAYHHAYKVTNPIITRELAIEIRRRYDAIPKIGNRKKLGAVRDLAIECGVSLQIVRRVGRRLTWGQ